MSNLLKRIDSWIAEYIPNDLAELLADCRAEIERLSLINESIKGLNRAYVAKSRKQTAEIKRLSKPYVPMRIDDEVDLTHRYCQCEVVRTLVTYTEYAVIKRYNEQRGVE